MNQIAVQIASEANAELKTDTSRTIFQEIPVAGFSGEKIDGFMIKCFPSTRPDAESWVDDDVFDL